MRTIVLATDGSESAKRATEVAATMAHAVGCKLSILTVEGRVTENIEQFAKAEGNIADAFAGFSDQILHQARQVAKETGVVSLEVQSGWGDPAEVIIDKARSEKADLIVVGRRGRGRLAGLLLGSVSQKLVSLAPCAVLIVP